MSARIKKRVRFAGTGVLLALAGLAAWASHHPARAAPQQAASEHAAAGAYTLECAAISSGGGALTDPGSGADRGFAVVGQPVVGVMTGPNYTFEAGIVPCLFAPVPTVRPDFDGDGDVDQEDFGHFQRCLTGMGIGQTAPACAGARLDGDTDVDEDDFAIFQRCTSGPRRPADPACDD